MEARWALPQGVAYHVVHTKRCVIHKVAYLGVLGVALWFAGLWFQTERAVVIRKKLVYLAVYRNAMLAEKF